MKTNLSPGERHEVIMAGVGGMGIQMAGMLLARAGRQEYRHATWCPLYTTAMRYGACECTVMLSNDRIASPLKHEVGEMVIIASSQLKSFEHRTIPGGLIVLETAGLSDGVARDDVRVLQVPGVETALNLGSRQISNLILLGAYVAATGAVAPRLIERELEERLGGREALLSLNKRAFERGLELGAKFEG